MSQPPEIRKLFPAAEPVPSAGALRRVFVRDLVGECYLGVHSHERGSRQRVRINLEVAVTDLGAPPNDAIADVVCYEDLVTAVRDLLAGPHTSLVETLAERIAGLAFEDRRVVSARVRVEKLDVFADTAAVGVEIERVRGTS